MKITLYGCSETILYGTDDDCSRLNSDMEMVVGSNSRMVMVSCPIKAKLFVKRGSPHAGWGHSHWNGLGPLGARLPLTSPQAHEGKVVGFNIYPT